MDVEQEGGLSVSPSSLRIRGPSSDEEDGLSVPSPPGAGATLPFDLTPPATPAPESASAGASLGPNTSRSAPSSWQRDESHISEGRRRSESSVPAFERDDELLPPSAVAPDKRSFALDDLDDMSTLAVFRVRPSSISATSPVYSSFEHPTPALAPSRSSFSALPPSVAECFAATGATHPPSRASSADEVDFDGILTATCTPVAVTPLDGFGTSHPPGSPPPFTLPSSAASPQQRNVFSDSDGEDIPSASSFFTPDTSSASTGFYTPGNAMRDPLLRDPGNSNHSKTAPRNQNALSLEPSISLSPGSSTHPRSCEVYIGVFGTDPLLLRYTKWLHAELESHGMACFSADRSLYADQRSHDIARGIMHAAAFGVVLVARKSFRNPYTIEELTIFLDRENLVPVFFDVAPPNCLVRDIVENQGEIWEEDGGELWKAYSGEEKGWSEAVKGLLTVEEFRVEAHNRNWRSSIQRVVALVGSRLGRTIITDRGMQTETETEELPWPRNPYFAGREKELKHIEKLLFEHPNPKTGEQRQTMVSSLQSDASSKDVETEDLESSRPSNYDSQNYEEKAWNALTGSGLGVRDRGRKARRALREKRRGESRKEYSSSACAVTGIPGIGKSELALEFAYRHWQKYRMVLWVGGEARYLRQNYLNLGFRLGVNVGRSETHPSPRRVAFEEQESEAVAKIRYELQKDIPYLLIIDNLDHLDARELSELLPRARGATHVVVTTRLPRVLHLASLEVAYLSSFEALTLMRDGKRSARSFSVQQVDKFKEFEDKLRRLPFGIAIVGRLINEFNMKPSEILAKVGAMRTMGSSIDVTKRSSRETDDAVLRSNPFLVKLLDVCFDLMGGHRSLAVRMAYVSGWFAPAACPLALLASAAKKLANLDRGANSMVSCCYWRSSASARRTEADARDLLTRLGLARAVTGSGSDCDDCLYFPDIVQVYCQKRGGVLAASAFVRVIRKHGHVVHHYEHFWAAAYLVCRNGSGDAAVVELQMPELLDFTRRIVIPVAIRAFHSFARCNAAVEVLRLGSAMLEDVEKSYVAQIQDHWDGPSLCWRRDTNVPHQVDEYVWQDLTLLKALLLEVRAKLLMRGEQYDAGEELCRTCISIRIVMLGEDHPDTLAAQETLSKFVRKRNSSSS